MPSYRVVADAGLNIRSGPGTGYPKETTFPVDEILESPDTSGWLPIALEEELEDGTKRLYIGWGAEKHLMLYTGPTVETPPTPVGKATGRQVVAKAMTQAGDPYIFGTEVDLADPDPDAFDCSELVQWVCAQLKVQPVMPDGAIWQRDHCRNHGTLITLAEAVKTPGALLFRIQANGSNHVVISRGDGSTIEAKGSAYGVGVFSLNAKNFTHAGLIPGVSYT